MNQIGPWSKHWKFVEPLGGGGQGDTSIVVCLNDSNFKGVIKCLKKDKEFDPKARRRMFQEVSNLKVLHGAGANVPKVIDDNTASFETSELLFFVMEFIQGETLSDVVKKDVLKMETAIEVALKLCDTLRYAAKERIIHRDIKPENIIVRSLSPTDIVMVDFGIARNESDSANVTEVGETFDNKFISLPERRGPEENKRDPRSDLTGLCAILLYSLTKCIPRDLRDSSDRPPHRWSNYTLDKVVPNEIQRSLLNAFFDRGFSWELNSRFQTLDELVFRIKEVQNPAASIPEEDLEVVAARESALLRKSDRVSQLADFRQAIHKLEEKWNQHVEKLGRKLIGSRFYVHRSNLRPSLGESDFGDVIDTFFLQMGVQNHEEIRVMGYHFCSIGEECSIVRKVERAVQQHHGGYMFDTVEAPTVIVRYSGDRDPTFELLAKDTESVVGRLTSHLRDEIERKYHPKNLTESQ